MTCGKLSCICSRVNMWRETNFTRDEPAQVDFEGKISEIYDEDSVSGLSGDVIESGYTVETVFVGSKLGIEPYSIELLPNGEMLILDSANSNMYKISSSLSLYAEKNTAKVKGKNVDASKIVKKLRKKTEKIVDVFSPKLLEKKMEDVKEEVYDMFFL